MCPLTCLQYPGISGVGESLLTGLKITAESLGHKYIEYLCLDGDDRMYAAARDAMRYVTTLRGVCCPQGALPLPCPSAWFSLCGVVVTPHAAPFLL